MANLKSSFLNFSLSKCWFRYLKSVTNHFFPELFETTDRRLCIVHFNICMQRFLTRSTITLLTNSLFSRADLWLGLSGKENNGNLYPSFIQLITRGGAGSSCSQKTTFSSRCPWTSTICGPACSNSQLLVHYYIYLDSYNLTPSATHIYLETYQHLLYH